MTATGCNIVRVACPRQEDADALAEIARKSQIPVIADIHFQPKYIFAAIDAGCAAVVITSYSIHYTKLYDDVATTKRWVTPADGGETTGPSDVGSIGIAAAQFGPTHYNVLSAVPGTFAFTGDLAVLLGKSLLAIPTKVGALVHAIGGGA